MRYPPVCQHFFSEKVEKSVTEAACSGSLCDAIPRSVLYSQNLCSIFRIAWIVSGVISAFLLPVRNILSLYPSR